MFRFWSNDSRGSGQTIVEAGHEPMQLDFSIPTQHAIPPTITSADSATASAAQPATSKRGREDEDSPDAPSPKRHRQAGGGAIDPSPARPSSDDVSFTAHLSDRKERAQDGIEFHFSLEILYKHEELRLIDQELAKCQVALEQLRRCHLIPYPVTCPTPRQMLQISSGKGPALRQQGKEVPRWAAPFGVVDGPYARHYAKWLIPDPMFDGMLPQWNPPHAASRARAAPEGRTTRNSIGDVATKGRPVRGNAGQKLQALTAGAAAPREKSACVLERKKDGVMVKLVCIDCHRENFLSIQGFINHCRIAHKRDFKSHEEAAIFCGHPVDATDGGAPQQPQQPQQPQPRAEEKQAPPTPAPSTALAAAPTPAPPPALAPQPSGLAHPLTRPEMTTQEAYVLLQSRIKESLKLYHQGKLPGVTCIPGQEKKKQEPTSSFVPSAETPYLSALMKSKKFGGDLQQMISDAKSPPEMDCLSSPGEEVDVFMMMDLDTQSQPQNQTSMSRAPMMRMPARSAIAPPPHLHAQVGSTRPTSSKGPSPQMPYGQPMSRKQESGELMTVDEDMESPNTVTSNVAPSLVSDDGEYDDSDDGTSVSDAGSDNIEAESISDVTELNMEDDGDAPRLRHQGCSGAGTAVRLRKDDNKTVTLVSPVKNAGKERRHRNV